VGRVSIPVSEADDVGFAMLLAAVKSISAGTGAMADEIVDRIKARL